MMNEGERCDGVCAGVGVGQQCGRWELGERERELSGGIGGGEGGREVRDFGVGRGTTGNVGRLGDRAGGEECSGDHVTSSGNRRDAGHGCENPRA